MSNITLIRHGQANSTARNEADYDRLSDLGRQQSAWLGAHLRGHRTPCVRLYTGTLDRQVQTAAAMDIGVDPIRDPRLNELEYFLLAAAMQSAHGLPIPTEREGFVSHLPQVFAAWHEDRLGAVPESFADFDARIRDVMTEIAAGEGPALVVTSGGLIAMLMRQALRLDMHATAALALAIFNTSLHRLVSLGGALSPMTFNAIPHLEAPDRHHAQTHI